MAPIQNRDLTGRKAIIYDTNGEQTIAETTVLDFDREGQTITVRAPALDSGAYERVSILVLCEDGVHEYQGNVRGQSNPKEWEIALFRGRVKDSRANPRYVLKIPARVENLMFARRRVPLRAPLEVEVVNLSGAGVLLRAREGLLNIGTAFELRMQIAEAETVVSARVVRLTVLQADQIEYGCSF